MIFHLIKYSEVPFGKSTSGSDVYLQVPPIELVKLLGPPEECDTFKVSGEYTFLCTLNGKKAYIRLYDWKSTSLYDPDLEDPEDFWSSEEDRLLNIGGCEEGKNHANDFVNCIMSQINSNTLKFIRED